MNFSAVPCIYIYIYTLVVYCVFISSQIYSDTHKYESEYLLKAMAYNAVEHIYIYIHYL